MIIQAKRFIVELESCFCLENNFISSDDFVAVLFCFVLWLFFENYYPTFYNKLFQIEKKYGLI